MDNLKTNASDEAQNPAFLVGAVISRLKSIRRFNLANYREGDFGIDTEREYDGNGDYIDSYEIDTLIEKLSNYL